MISLETMADYVGVRLPEPGYNVPEASRAQTILTELLFDATVMVDERLKESGLARIPTKIYDLAIMRLVAELWNQRNSPNGKAMWGPDGQVAYLSADPMTSVMPLLRPYLPIGACG